jgi:NAD(P)-dependent dehydrogenase (short-subunit alcohol dehydrogenase family)
VRQLERKTCVITGGAGSIGLASARLFLLEGARVMLVDLEEAALQRAAGQLSADGIPAERIGVKTADVARAQEVADYVAATVSRWGRIDVLFSNAGNAGAIESITTYPEQVFDQVYRVHVKGAFLACKHGKEQPGACQADAAGSPGDDARLALQLSHHGLRSDLEAQG